MSTLLQKFYHHRIRSILFIITISVMLLTCILQVHHIVDMTWFIVFSLVLVFFGAKFDLFNSGPLKRLTQSFHSQIGQTIYSWIALPLYLQLVPLALQKLCVQIQLLMGFSQHISDIMGILLILASWLLLLPVVTTIALPLPSSRRSTIIEIFWLILIVFDSYTSYPSMLILNNDFSNNVLQAFVVNGVIALPLLFIWLATRLSLANVVLPRPNWAHLYRHWWGSLLILLVIMMFWGSNATGLKAITWHPSFFSLAFRAGVGEELLFRFFILILIYRVLKQNKHRVLWTIWSQALLFGLWHTSNILAGAPISGVIGQVIFAITFGIIMGQIYAWSGNIILVMMIHGVGDYLAFIATDSVLAETATWHDIAQSVVWLIVVMIVSYVLTTYCWQNARLLKS